MDPGKSSTLTSYQVRCKKKYVQQRKRRTIKKYTKENPQDILTIGLDIALIEGNASNDWNKIHEEAARVRRNINIAKDTEGYIELNEDSNVLLSPVTIHSENSEGSHDADNNEHNNVEMNDKETSRVTEGDNSKRRNGNTSAVLYPDNENRGNNDDDNHYRDDVSDDDNDDDDDDDDDDNDDDDDDDDDGEGDYGDDNDDNDMNEDDEDDNDEQTFSIRNRMQRLMEPIKVKRGPSYLSVLLGVLIIAIRHNLLYNTIENMLSITAMPFVTGNPLPTSMKSLWKFLYRNDEATSVRHYFCTTCSDVVGNRKIPEKNCPCGKTGPGKRNDALSYFIQVKIESQLRNLFSDSSIVESLKYRFTRLKHDENSIEDIYDGAKYKKLCEPDEFLRNPNNFTFGLFTDGVKVVNSAGTSAWPVMLMIHEFPPHARKKYMILAGIWVDKGKPNIHSVLLPIVMELNHLYTTGLTWTNTVDQTEVTSKFLLTTCTADTVARPMIMNMTQFNGEYGCTYCYHIGKSMVKRGKTTSVHIYPNERVPSPCRTDMEIRQDMVLSSQAGFDNRVRGVKGIAAIMGIKGFDLGSGIPVDSMHNVFLGVAKFHTEMLMGSAASQWYCGGPNNKRIINNRLAKIRPPTRISRTPRNIDEFPQWKASEWRNWLFFFALMCLKGIIPDRFHKHLALLCNAAYILNKDSITADEIQEARRLIKKYVKQFEEYFGTNAMRYNVHLLTHLVDSVENWGPMWTHSAFPFESWNKQIVEKVTSPNSRALQIVTRFSLTRFVETLFNNHDINIETKKMMNKYLTKGLKKQNYVIDARLIKPLKFYGLKKMEERPLNDSEIESFRLVNYEPIPPLTVSFFERAVLKGTAHFSRTPRNNGKITRYCNEYIHCKKLGYGRITEIISFRGNENDDTIISGFIVEKLMIIETTFHTNHIHIVTPSTKVFVAHTDELLSSIKPAIALGKYYASGLFISRLANINETD